MESQPQNPEFRNNPENFNPCFIRLYLGPIGMDCVIRVSCYKEIILHFHGHFPIIPLISSMVIRFGTHNMTTLYPHLFKKLIPFLECSWNHEYLGSLARDPKFS